MIHTWTPNTGNFLTRGPRFKLNFCSVCWKKLKQEKRLTLKAERPLFFLSKMFDLSEMSGICRFVRKWSICPKCPDCPRMVDLSGLSENPVLLLCCGFRRSAHRKPETLHFPAGSIARIQELAALNGASAVRFKTQRRIEQTESDNPAGVHCGHLWRGGLQNA